MTKLAEQKSKHTLSVLLALAFLVGKCSVLGFQLPHAQPLASSLSFRLCHDDATMTRRITRTIYQVNAVKLESDTNISPLGLPPVDDNADGTKLEKVPTEMMDAVKVFFFSPDYGPLMVVASLVGFVVSRFQMSPIQFADILV